MKDNLEKFIAQNRDAFDDKMPPPFVLGRILEEMQPEKKDKPAGIVISFKVMRWAAACLILIAGAATFLVLHHQPDNNIAVVKIKPHAMPNDTATEVSATNKPVKKSIDSVDDALNLRKQTLVAKLQKHRLRTQKTVMFASVHDMDSPASRLADAMTIEKLAQKDNYVIDALVKILNNDPNSNVRLTALDGLARFYQEAYVRQQLTESLNKQHDPVVQIAMINMLIRMRTSGILEQLEQLVNDQNTQKAVRDCAYSGINQLRSS